MTRYIAALTAIAVLGTAAAGAAETPAAAKPIAAAAVASVPHYVQAPGAGALTFSFVQAGAWNQGQFKQFATQLAFDEKNLGASSLKVTVQTASFDTQDKDRDDTLASPELLDPKQFPTAQFVASSFTKGPRGIEAVGKLTLHGVTKDLRLPLNIRTTATGVEISGETTLQRLDYGIGQGDWKTTEWVGDEVKLQYKVPLTKAAR